MIKRIGAKDGVCVRGCLRAVGPREEFLYRIYGSRVLIEKKENE